MDDYVKYPCGQCKNEYPIARFTHCPVCEIPLPETNHNIHLNQSTKGNDNKSIQIGGNNSGDIIINQPQVNEPDKTLIYRSMIKPLHIGGNKVKVWWLIASGTLGLIGNLASIVGTWMTFASNNNLPTTPSPQIGVWIMIISGLLLLSGLILQRSKYITLLFFSRMIEADKQGQLYLTQVSGTCGICKSPVDVKNIGPKEARETKIVCKNNPDQHFWTFDRTVLPEVQDDYLNNETLR